MMNLFVGFFPDIFICNKNSKLVFWIVRTVKPVICTQKIKKGS